MNAELASGDHLAEVNPGDPLLDTAAPQTDGLPYAPRARNSVGMADPSP